MPMLGDGPFEGWAPGYFDDPNPYVDESKLPQYTEEVNTLKEQGYSAYAHGSYKRTPCLWGLVKVLRELGGYGIHKTAFIVGDTNVKVVTGNGLFGGNDPVKVVLSIGDKSVTITEEDLAGTDLFTSVKNHAMRESCAPTYLMNRNKVIEYIATKYAELTSA